MSVEMRCLFAAMVLALVHLTAASFSFKAQVGNRYSVGPRDEDIRPTGLAGRLDRAQRNFLETFPVFVAAVLMVHLLRIGAEPPALQARCFTFDIVRSSPTVCVECAWLRTFSWNIATLSSSWSWRNLCFDHKRTKLGHINEAACLRAMSTAVPAG